MKNKEKKNLMKQFKEMRKTGRTHFYRTIEEEARHKTRRIQEDVDWWLEQFKVDIPVVIKTEYFERNNKFFLAEKKDLFNALKIELFMTDIKLEDYEIEWAEEKYEDSPYTSEDFTEPYLSVVNVTIDQTFLQHEDTSEEITKDITSAVLKRIKKFNEIHYYHSLCSTKAMDEYGTWIRKGCSPNGSDKVIHKEIDTHFYLRYCNISDQYFEETTADNYLSLEKGYSTISEDLAEVMLQPEGAINLFSFKHFKKDTGLSIEDVIVDARTKDSYNHKHIAMNFFKEANLLYL